MLTTEPWKSFQRLQVMGSVRKEDESSSIYFERYPISLTRLAVLTNSLSRVTSARLRGASVLYLAVLWRVFVLQGVAMEGDSSIPASFQEQTVLVSGATGFMGKVLTEKLLRSCPDLRHIYLLVREKKGKTMHQRLDEIFLDPVTIIIL